MLNTLEQLNQTAPLNGATRKMAIIDVGSNSFRLIVMDYVPGYRFQLTDEIRETVRLVQGLSSTGRLGNAPMAHARETMRLYASFCRAAEITDVIAVATSAVREADNGMSFLRSIKQDTGFDVRVLSGEEEAYYGVIGAQNSTTLRNGFVFDLGGGSVEITRVEDRRSQESVSLTLGAVRTTEEFLPEAPATKAAIAKLRKHIQSQLAPLGWFKTSAKTRIVGQGGSLRNVARMVQKTLNYPMDELHGYVMQTAHLQDVIARMEPLSVEQRRRLPGMKPDRADIALAGAIVIDECLRFADYDRMTICSQGVREGLFYERFLSQITPPIFEDVRTASVMNVAHLYDYHARHVNQVAHLALSLFDQLHDDPLMGLPERDLLWAACMLHDIGMSVDYNDHHRHGSYLVLSSGLPGYTHRELALIALMVSFHRKGMPELGELAPVMEKDDDRRLIKMAALLRLAEQLDRSRDGSVRDVRLHFNGEKAVLEAVSQADVSVALWSAQNHVDIFKAAFGKTLEIVHITD